LRPVFRDPSFSEIARKAGAGDPAPTLASLDRIVGLASKQCQGRLRHCAGEPAAKDTRRWVGAAIIMAHSKLGRPGSLHMTVNVLVLQPAIALIAGILILLVPRILNYVVALYLIIVGVLGLWGHVGLR
jgi:hypothetical protein